MCHMTDYYPAQTGEYLTDIPLVVILNKHNSHNKHIWHIAKNMLAYLSTDICSKKLLVFLELHSWKTMSFSEQIMTMDKIYIKAYFWAKWRLWLYILAFYRRIYFTDNCILIQGIEEATAVLFLPRLLREKGGSTDFIKICTVRMPNSMHNQNINVTYKVQ